MFAVKQFAEACMQIKKFKAPFMRLIISIIIIFSSTMLVLNYWSNQYFNTTIKLHRESLRHIVSLARNSISYIITQVQEGAITRAEGIRRTRNVVRRMVYRDRYGMNYIFMSAYNGIMLVQPFEPSKEMTNQWDLRDIRGTYIIRRLVNTARTSPRGGFVSYHYYPPGSTAPKEKIAFVIGIPELGCYIGTGMYMEHVYNEQREFIRKARFWAIAFMLLMLFPVSIFTKNIINQNKKLEVEVEERKRAETSLKANAIFLNTLLEAIPHPVFYKNREGAYTGCNSAFETITGIAREKLIDISPRDAEPPSLTGEFTNMDDALLGNSGPLTYESVIQYADGTFHDVIFAKATFTGADGEIAGIVGIINDISTRKKMEDELRKSEERFRNISEIANDYIYYADINPDNSFTIAWSYGNFKNLYGYSEVDVEEAGGLSHRIHPDDYQRIMDTYQELLDGNKIINEYRISTGNGTYKWIKNILKPVWNDDDTGVEGFFSIIQDITVQKEAHEQLIDSLREKETLLKEIHHRVKNNLQVITSLLSIQSRKINNPEFVSKLADSQNRIRAMALIHEKLYGSENLSSIDFSRYLKSLAGELFLTLGGNAQGISMQYSLEELNLGIDQAIPCGLIVNELISNAIKHGFKDISGEKVIQVKLETDTSKNIRITVKDNGQGLPENTGLNRTESLGLALVPMLAKQINGEITVSVTSGTEFILTFTDVS